ncbi:MAG: YbjN domain-containing protein [Pseudomonadota bacterium]
MSDGLLIDDPATVDHPIDLAEEIASGNEWPFERASAGELVCEVSGQYCDYRLFFAWRADAAAVHLACLVDIRVDDRKRANVHVLHGLINEKLWIGHFELCSEQGAPLWRHTLLNRGLNAHDAIGQLEEAVETALNECERYYPAHQFLLWGGQSPDAAFEMALFETAGEA